MSVPLLLEEMFSNAIAEQLTARGHDVRAVVADRSLVALPDEPILAQAAAEGRALVTANIKDFVPLDTLYRSAGWTHSGIVLVSTGRFHRIAHYPGPLWRPSPSW